MDKFLSIEARIHQPDNKVERFDIIFVRENKIHSSFPGQTEIKTLEPTRINPIGPNKCRCCICLEEELKEISGSAAGVDIMGK